MLKIVAQNAGRNWFYMFSDCWLIYFSTVLRFMDMRSQFDPRTLAEEAVNLNLRLMLWRAAPSLDTAKIAESKCLLLGA